MFTHWIGEDKMVPSLWTTVWKIASYKFRCSIIIILSIPYLGIYPREMKQICKKDLHINDAYISFT